MASKLVSCIGYAIRLSNRIGCTGAVRSHLHQAMICLKSFGDDEARPQGPVERDAKRRKIIKLSTCLGVDASVRHSFCQTDGRYVDEQELHQLFLEIQDQGNKTAAMVNDKIQELRRDFDAALARQAQQHSVSIQQSEDTITNLQLELNSLHQELSEIRRGHATLTKQASPPSPGFPAADGMLGLVSWTDLVQVSMCSRSHFESFGPPVFDPGLPAQDCLGL
eukprot:Skav216386  [mRNA]  locus=scaffold1241:245372:246037:+ [translate_table: standard]